MSRPKRFWSLNIGICDLFVIWCLEFVILDTKLQGKAGKPWPGPLGTDSLLIFIGKVSGTGDAVVLTVF